MYLALSYNKGGKVMKKRFLLLVTACVLTMSLVACGGSEANDASNNETNVNTQEAGTQVAEEPEVEGTFVFDVPEGFAINEDGIYASVDGTYLSNIYCNEVANDGSFDNVSSELLLEAIEPELEAAYEQEFELKLVEEEFYEIDGHRAYRYAFEYEVYGTKILQIQHIIETKELFKYVTYTVFNDEACLEAFKASEATFRFE